MVFIIIKSSMPDELECNFRINNKSTYHFMFRFSIGGETAAIHMHEKENLVGAFWLVLLIITGWGGLVRCLIDVKQSKATWSWINAFAQTVVSGFTSVIGGLTSIESGLGIYMILATVGISGAMGLVALTYFWERPTRMKNAKS